MNSSLYGAALLVAHRVLTSKKLLSRASEILPVTIVKDLEDVKDCCFVCDNTNLAINHGHVCCLNRMIDLFQMKTRGFPQFFTQLTTRSICYTAARQGRLNCLKLAHDKGCDWDELTTIGAAENGHLDCLMFAFENGCPWDENVTHVSALNGHKHCLQFAFENGCRWHPETALAAARNGHLDCLEFVMKNGFPWHFVRD